MVEENKSVKPEIPLDVQQSIKPAEEKSAPPPVEATPVQVEGSGPKKAKPKKA